MNRRARVTIVAGLSAGLIASSWAAGQAMNPAAIAESYEGDEKSLIDTYEEDTRAQQFAELARDVESNLGPDQFGGAFTDGAGRLVVQAVNAPNDGRHPTLSGQSLDGMASEIGLRGEFDVREVTYSLDELRRVQDSLRGQVERLANSGAYVRLGIDLPNNRVELTTSAPDAHVLSAEISSDFGDAVKVDYDNPDLESLAYRRYDENPYKGGAAMWAAAVPYAAWDATCTAGFAFRRLADNVRGMTTAGHCILGGVDWWNFQTKLGDISQSTWIQGGWMAADAAFIPPAPGRSFTPRIWVGGRSTGEHWPVVGAINEGPEFIGSPILIDGANSGQTRGEVTGVDITICLPEHQGCVDGTTEFVVTQETASDAYGLRPGDSGAPCWSIKGGTPHTVLARGLLSMGITIGNEDGTRVGGMGYCTQIFDVSAELDAWLVTTVPD
jgi:hypothetical protein